MSFHSPLPSETGQPYAHAEEALRRANRAYRLLSVCNRIVVRAEDEATLLKRLCQALVEEGEYRLAWIGFAEQTPERALRPVAWAGHDADYLATIPITWADDEHGQGPCGRAIRTGHPQVARFIADDPDHAVWRAEALRRGCQSVAAVPFVVDEGLMGVLSVCAASPDAFTEDDLTLLNELAHDLSYGLRALRARRALQDATRALADLAQHQLEADRTKLLLSMAVHDLRHPLSVIQTAIDLLVRYGDRLSADEQQRRRERIAENISFMSKWLDDISLMSKADLQQLPVQPETFDIVALARQVLIDTAQSALQHRLEFECAETSATVTTDPTLLRHILTNLLENAVRYSPPDSTVTLSLDRQPDRVILRVQDRGIGIPAADQAHLFEPFFRGSNVSGTHGTGLGLTIVKQAVEALEGSIQVESVEGQGTTFTVTLPLRCAG